MILLTPRIERALRANDHARHAAIHLPFGLRIERDIAFASLWPLSFWADWARREGSTLAAERALALVSPPDLLPPRVPPEGTGG